MKCPDNCNCRRHSAAFSDSRRGPQRQTYNNTTFSPRQRAITSTYGEHQRERMKMVTAERQAQGIEWHDRPSERFDWGRAIAGFKLIMKEFYGTETE
jgi:hypothetical protein